MPPTSIDATIIIFDIGRNVSELEEKNEESFFESARDCIIRIIERKIISRPKDLITVMLLGSNKTKNNLANNCEGSFLNIEMLSDLETPNWQILRKLPEKPTKHEGDWYESLIVAADYFKNCLHGIKVTNKKIVLMTNFKAPADPGDSVERVLQGFQDEQFEVTIIGPNLFSPEIKGDDADLARHFIEFTKGDCATFEEAMRYLLFHRKKVTRPSPWNVDLSIGPNIKIPVSVYARIRDESVLKTWQISVRDAVTGKSSTEEAVIKKKDYITTENQTIVEVEDTIEGYQYGQKVIPFSENEEQMLYKSGEKCLSIYGFTKASNIKWQNLSGNGVSYLFGRKDDQKAQHAIHCLIECLFEKDLVGIARRVYNNGNAPAMHVLIPIIDPNNFICLSVIAINYKEDIKNMSFPQINQKKYQCTNEQINAFKDLIKVMDLTCAYDITYDDQEAFPTAETVNPSIQHILDCIAFRAMNPGKPLPQPRDDIMMLFKMPEPVEKKSREPIEKLKKLFDLKPVVIKHKNRKQDQQQNNTNNDIGNDNDNPHNPYTATDIPKVQILKPNEEISYIGTIDPIGDFKTLLKNGKPLSELAVKLIYVIELFTFNNFNEDEVKNEVVDIIQCLRQECVKQGPSYYNEWFVKFKKDLHERTLTDTLNMLLEKHLNLITKDENDLSTFTSEDVDNTDPLFQNDTIPEMVELTIPSEIHKLFDEV